MPTDQEETVVTGLAAPAAPAQKSTIVTDAAEAPRADVPLVAISGLGDDVTSKVEEVNQPAEAAVQNFSRDTLTEAENENMRQDFMADLKRANTPVVNEYQTPAIPVRIAEQTRLEQEAGRARVAEFEAQKVQRPQPEPQKNGTMTEVFRPDDFVPDQKKGQGLIASNSARTLS